VTEVSRAVFLSYASQDAEVARRICATLRAAGVEVWFDQSELRGGDAWDQSIRRQIKSCALFVPIISQNTRDRDEGYFRLEWKLAIDRSHLMSAEKAFLLPVVIDGTSDDDPRSPERFREVQWTHLPGGDVPPAFVERVQRLLSGTGAAVPHRAPSAAAVAGDAITQRARSPGRSARRTGLWMLAALAAVVALAIGYFSLDRLKRPPPVASAVTSIAVLPLVDESGESGQQYFSDGISEDLITALGQFPGLRVIGRSSAFQFRDSKENSRSIGAKLGVAHLIEGSVRKSGDVIRVSAELIDTSDGSIQWSEHFDRPYKDLFALQDEITHAVASALKTRLLPGGQVAPQSERPPSGSLDAYSAMLQGRFNLRRGTEEGYQNAIQFYSRATEIDANYAYAWSGLSLTWSTFGGQFLSGSTAQDAYAKSRAAADKALALAPDLGYAHAARAQLLEYADLNWPGAERESRRAVALAPNDDVLKFYLAQLLAAFGKLPQALALTQQALASDPLHASYYTQLSTILLSLGRLDESERAIHRGLELDPGSDTMHVQSATVALVRGNAEAALEAARQTTPGIWKDVLVAWARQVGTDRNAADAALKALIDKWAGSADYQIAQTYAIRNDPDSTFDWLERAWTSRDSGLILLLYDPLLARFAHDPRFTAFRRKIGLPDPRA